jgi:hypothetical protein
LLVWLFGGFVLVLRPEAASPKRSWMCAPGMRRFDLMDVGGAVTDFCRTIADRPGAVFQDGIPDHRNVAGRCHVTFSNRD